MFDCTEVVTQILADELKAKIDNLMREELERIEYSNDTKETPTVTHKELIGTSIEEKGYEIRIDLASTLYKSNEEKVLVIPNELLKRIKRDDRAMALLYSLKATSTVLEDSGKIPELLEYSDMCDRVISKCGSKYMTNEVCPKMTKNKIKRKGRI